MHTQTSLSTQEGAGKCLLQTILLNFRKLYDPRFWFPRGSRSFSSACRAAAIPWVLHSSLFCMLADFLGLETAKEASKALTVTSHLCRKEEEVKAWSAHC